jgi:hypothetical protein
MDEIALSRSATDLCPTASPEDDHDVRSFLREAWLIGRHRT